MAIREHVISAITEIPALVYSFATDLGWVISGNAGEPVLRHPSDNTAMPVKFSVAVSSDAHRASFTGNGTLGTNSAVINSPWRPDQFGVSTPVAPSYLYLISEVAGLPFFAIIVRYGEDTFRHLYFGHTEKIGVYSGGEVIAGGYVPEVPGTGNLPWYDKSISHMFSANGVVDEQERGGIRVQHADNPNPWRYFSGFDVDWAGGEYADEQTAFGGIQDGINSGYLARGKNTFSGMVNLVPINLYIMRPGGLVSAVGVPPGIRMINVADILPTDELDVGDETWKVFPAFRKSTAANWSRQAGVPIDETSMNLGYAYRI